MEQVVTDKGTVVIGGKRLDVDVDEARILMRKMRMRKGAALVKRQKVVDRIKLLERFINDARGTNITLAEWMAKRGLDYTKFYTSVGYYTPLQAVVSDDKENEVLIYHRNMKFNPQAGFYVPNRKVVNDGDHSIVTKSSLGMTYDPKLALYFPTTIYDTDAYSSAEGSGDEAIDIMGGLTVDDIGNLKVTSEEAEELTDHVKDLFEDELDNVDTEVDTIILVERQLYENFSNADAQAGKNAVCRGGCSAKHPFSAKKRQDCKEDCDAKYPPSQKQDDRREDREARQDARKEKREDKRDAKKEMKEGNISREEYRRRKKAAREEKRDKIKAAGGSFMARAWKGVAKVFPITLAGRGGALILIGENAFGFATRVAPALLPPSEANKKFTPDAIVGAKKAWIKLQRAWANLGGNTDKLKAKILQGYKKKPMKVSKKSGFDGYDTYSFDKTLYVEDYSNVDPASLATAITAGLTTVAGLLKTIIEAKQNPYKTGEAPDEFLRGLDEGAMIEPEPDPNAPKYDPNTGEWIDPSSGRPIDPQTGEFKDNVLGMNKWLAIGLGVALVTAIVLIVRKSGKTK